MHYDICSLVRSFYRGHHPRAGSAVFASPVVTSPVARIHLSPSGLGLRSHHFSHRLLCMPAPILGGRKCRVVGACQFLLVVGGAAVDMVRVIPDRASPPVAITRMAARNARSGTSRGSVAFYDGWATSPVTTKPTDT